MNKPRLPKGLPGVIATNHHHMSGKGGSDERRLTQLLIQQLTKPDISVSKHHHIVERVSQTIAARLDCLFSS
jgi:hypothetical protein